MSEGRALCPRCGRPLKACICQWIVPVDNTVQVLILQHPLEVRQAKGSARLLALSLRACRMEVGEVFPLDALQAWLSEGLSRTHTAGRTVLLYPEAHGTTPAASSPSSIATREAAAPVTRLVVLDGTWRKSLKMLHHNPALQALPRLALQPDAPSRYLIRKAHRPDQLSTLEATCLALSELEGAPERYAPLLSAFEGFVAAGTRFL